MQAIKKNWGFSYVEMVFAVAMLALLAAVATPYLEKNMQRKKESELKQSLREMRTAIDRYKDAADAGKIAKRVGDSGYPHRLQDLIEGIDDITSPTKTKLRFLRKIPIDPMYPIKMDTARPVAPEDTWGKRSYASDTDNPREGDDVYDVYSTSPQVGNNGVPYEQW